MELYDHKISKNKLKLNSEWVWIKRKKRNLEIEEKIKSILVASKLKNYDFTINYIACKDLGYFEVQFLNNKSSLQGYFLILIYCFKYEQFNFLKVSNYDNTLILNSKVDSFDIVLENLASVL